MAQKKSENKAAERPEEYRLPSALYVGGHCLGSVNERASRALLRNRFEAFLNKLGIPEDPKE